MTPNSYRLPLVELKELPAGSNQSETYRHLLGLALKAKSAPMCVDISSLPSTMIRISPALRAQLDHVSEQFDMEFKVVFAGLCAAGAEIWRRDLRKQAGIDKKVVAAFEPSFEPKSVNQRRFYEHIMLGLSSDKIVFAEGSTGIGKSRSMGASAIEMARAKKTPVIMSAPTIAVMEHLYEELCLLDTTGVTFLVLPGASEFVDDVLLKDYIAAAEFDESLDIDIQVVEWVRSGAKPLDYGTPLARSLGADAAWLMDDLRRLAVDMPVADFMLRRDLDLLEGSEARRLVAALRRQAKTETDIIICTHAMLALGQKTQWRALPEPCVLFVDEAHQFEHAVASMNSDQVSLYSLRAALSNLRRATGAGKTSIVAKAADEARSLSTVLQKLDNDGKTLCLTERESTVDQGAIQQVTAGLRSLGEKLGSRVVSEAKGIEHYRSAVSAMLRSLEGRGGASDRVDLSFSPDRRYPSLYCGPARVDMQLRHIWKTAKGGVVLASATLYVMDGNGNSKCDYLRGLLAVDFDRLSTPAPVVENFLYTVPTLYLPSKERQPELIPPGNLSENTESDWHSGMARALEHIASTAFGGTLVLFTAYKDIAALSERLVQSGVPAARIVAQQPNRKFSETERLYREAHRAGLRPILLGLGTAWTGIDLMDDQVGSEEDSLLTDLVVARLPIGLNRSNSMTARIERMGMHPIINEALLTFKQGVGRLMRRDGVKHRRIWVLDGRISSDFKWQGMETLAGSIRRFLREYRNRKEF